MFRLEKTNARTTAPNDPTVTVLAGNQRTDGFELELAGEIMPRWDVSAAYAYLNAEVVESNTTAVGTASGLTLPLEGTVPINVPKHSGVVWSSYASPMHGRSAAACSLQPIDTPTASTK